MGLSVIMLAYLQQRSTSSRQALREPGAHPARVRNHVWFFPYREAPRSGIRLQCACNRFQMVISYAPPVLCLKTGRWNTQDGAFRGKSSAGKNLP